jgi:hypothetical protein
MIDFFLCSKVDSTQTEHFRNLLTVAKALKFNNVDNWCETISCELIDCSS